MIAICRSALTLLWLLTFGGAVFQSKASAAPSSHETEDIKFEVSDLVLTGLERTDRDWLVSYIDQPFPTRLSAPEVQAIARKLMTTGVFTDVKATLEPMPGTIEQFALHVHVEEKWTTIPVVRGVYGGGTPLRILGVYDTHVLGQLLTVGGEVRKYGDAPPGFVVYGRDPRSHAGRYYLGIEFWRDFRRRQIYDREGKALGAASTNAAITRLRMLTPLNTDAEALKDFRWKYGFDLETIQEAPSIFDANAENASDLPPKDLPIGDGKRRQLRVLPTLVYDDIDVSVVEYDGFRTKIRVGLTITEHRVHGSTECELFGYKLWPYGFNLAAHGFVGRTSYTSLQNQYFLGGFDSVRGLPDGAIYGTHAAYANLELRHLSYKAKFLWFQTVVFADTGGAGAEWSQVADDRRASGGVGLRLAVPQIYRMVFRVDYAWSLDKTGSKGITAGMNQFFDPYTPL